MAGGGSTGWFADPLLMGVAGRGPDVAVAGGLALDILEGLALKTGTGVWSAVAPLTGNVTRISDAKGLRMHCSGALLRALPLHRRRQCMVKLCAHDKEIVDVVVRRLCSRVVAYSGGRGGSSRRDYGCGRL